MCLRTFCNTHVYFCFCVVAKTFQVKIVINEFSNHWVTQAHTLIITETKITETKITAIIKITIIGLITVIINVEVMDEK